MNRHHPFVPARLLSYLCAVVLALAAILAPARVAWALEPGEDAFKKAVQGETLPAGETPYVTTTTADGVTTVTLLQNITLSSDFGYANIDGSKKLVINLSGHMLTMKGESRIALKGSSELTVTNGSIMASARTNTLFEVTDSSLTLEGVTETGEGTAGTWTEGAVIKATGTQAVVNINAGTTLTNNVTTVNGGAIYIGQGTLNISGGTISYNKALGAGWNEGGGAIYLREATLNLTGGSIEHNEASTNGGGIHAAGSDAKHSVIDMSGGTITDNTANGNNDNDWGGGGIYLHYSDLNLSGQGSIAHNISHWNGGGVLATGRSKVTISGGTIERNETGGSKVNAEGNTEYKACGGGILLGGSAELVMSGGSITANRVIGGGWYDGGAGIQGSGNSTILITGGNITNNISDAGGGGVTSWGQFTLNMTSGEISGNIAKTQEGGGISIMGGTAMFVAGTIANNYAGYLDPQTPNEDYENWGGGGIFVSDQGITSATAVFPSVTLVTDNHAGGYGGGLAACSTGRTYVLDQIGIYGNTADGENISGGGSAKHEDHTYAYDSEVFRNSEYEDYFSALFSYITNKMPGGYENWAGSADGSLVSLSGDDTLIATSVCGLTASPTGGVSEPKLIIRGNSSYTHGGGILNNGIIVYGNDREITVGKALVITGDKSLFDAYDVNLASLLLNADGSSRCEFEITEEGNNDVLSLGHVAEDIGEDGEIHSYIVFDRRLTFGEEGRGEGTYTFYVRETAVTPSWMQLDSTVYKLVVEVSKTTSTVTVPDLSDPNNTRTIAQNLFYISGVTATKITADHPEGVPFEVTTKLLGNGVEDLKRAGIVELSNDSSPYAFNNTASTLRSVSVTKVWADDRDADGIRPTAEEFASTLTLTANGEVVADAKPTVTPIDDTTYIVTYNDLPLYTVSEETDADGNKVGTEVVYAVTETVPDGYTATYANADAAVSDRALDGGTITNSHTPVDRPVPGALPPTGDADVPLGVVGGLMALGAALICTVALRIRQGLA